MSKSTVRCSMGHTALFPEKDDVRATYFSKVPSTGGIVLISHAALSVLNILRWSGPIQVCDIDPGVIESTRYLIEERRFPRLNLLPVSYYRDATDTVRDFCEERGAYNLKLVDLDLTRTLMEEWPVCRDVVQVLQTYKARTKVLLTFRNGRDSFGKDAINRRIEWIRSRLPKGVKLLDHRCYRSDWIGRKATREIGSSMCIVELQVG